MVKMIEKLIRVSIICLFSQGFLLAQDEGTCSREECITEDEHPGAHLHFSSEDVDIYNETPDTLYRESDWPSKIEEYSDYLSR